MIEYVAAPLHDAKSSMGRIDLPWETSGPSCFSPWACFYSQHTNTRKTHTHAQCVSEGEKSEEEEEEERRDLRVGLSWTKNGFELIYATICS